MTAAPRDPALAAWTAGRAAHPAVDVPLDRFAAHVAAAGADDAGLDRHGADLYLACACAAGDARALARFDEHVLAPAAAAVRSIDASPAFLDEVRQRVRAALLVPDGAPAAAKLTAYAGRGPLRAWVGVTAVRTALMML